MYLQPTWCRSMPGPLSQREVDVARLVARGHTNREIGDVLVISGRTADAHVNRIFRKLGFRSRAQMAVWAQRRNID